MTQEKLTNYETLNHIKLVSKYLHLLSIELLKRADLHDHSKLEDPELEIFMKYTPKLKDSTYGSEEYKQYLKEMKPALDHHYKNNRHHPEHFKEQADSLNCSPVDFMNLVDIVEMICDWLAATKRHDNGNIFKSIKINTSRFELSDQLAKILINTAFELEKLENENRCD